jgi:hypothetical protein
MALMGVREYGRHRGVSHVAVLKAVRTGRIRQTQDGLIDSDEADRDWAHNTHPAPRAPRAAPSGTKPEGGFGAARTVREHYEALLARLDYEEKMAKLVSADEVKIARFQTAQVFGEYMMRIPDHLAPVLAAETDANRVYELLSLAIRGALTDFADQCSPANGRDL